MTTTDQFLFDTILLTDSWQVPPPLLEEVITLEARRLAEQDQEPTIDTLFANPYLPLRF
jgi:hypothetical protein